MSMRAPDIKISKEGYIATGNLLSTASCQDCVQILDQYPGLLQGFVSGLEAFKNHEQVLISILTSLKIMLEKYPPVHSPLNIYEMLSKIDTFDKVNELIIECGDHHSLKPLLDDLMEMDRKYCVSSSDYLQEEQFFTTTPAEEESK